MEKVAGIGGFFFRARDPAALATWYADVLGIDRVPSDYETAPWQPEAGPTVFAPFPRESEMLSGGQGFMLNFRVDDLSAMVAQIERVGTTVTVDPETYPNGRFATLVDPEGNPIQLWEPA